MASVLIKQVAKTAATAKVAGFKAKPKKATLAQKIQSKAKFDVSTTQVKALRGFTGKPLNGSDSSSDDGSYDSDVTGDENDDDSGAQDGAVEGEDQVAPEAKKDLSPATIRRIRSQLKTVEDILLSGDLLEVGSDSDISDASQIWSEYGDEITVDKEQKLVRWNPRWKRIGQPIGDKTTSQKKTIKIKRIRKGKNDDTSTSKDTTGIGNLTGGSTGSVDQDDQYGSKLNPKEAGLSFVPTGPGMTSGKGVYYLDFSDEFRKCLKMAREDLEREKKISELQKAEANWIQIMKEDKEKTLQQKFQVLKLDNYVARSTGRSSSPRRDRRYSPNSSQRSSRMTSPSRVPKVEDNQVATAKGPSVSGPPAQGGGLIKPVLKQPGGPPQKKSVSAQDQSYDAMGSKWPKTMWDNTENYWRMVMAEDQFVITPASYNRQLEVDFRQKEISVDYSQLTNAKTKCLQWISANREYFTL